LAPSDFYLFGKLEMTLMGAAFADDDKFLQGAMKALNGISREELMTVFEEWRLRLDRSIQQNRGHIEQGEFNKHILIPSALSCPAMP
jgi:hypothetical protein